MAPSTIKTSMVYFSSLGGTRFSLASASGDVVVEGLDLDRGVDCWPNGDILLLRMGAHSCTAIYDKMAPPRAKESRPRLSCPPSQSKGGHSP